MESVERRHMAVETAGERQHTLRHHAFLVGAGSCIIGIPVTFPDPTKALPILAIAVLATLFSFLYRRRVERAAVAEDQALDEAGAESYLGFHLQRVNGLLSDSEHRRRLLAVAEDHHDAARRWLTWRVT